MAKQSTAQNCLAYIDSGNIAGISHRGQVRRQNEDSFFYALNKDHSRLIAAVADGIGGNENGEIASRVLCKMLSCRWRKFADSSDFTAQSVSSFLMQAIMEINQALFAINSAYECGKPMGSTVAVLVVLPQWIVTAHSGDSRIYRLRGRTFEFLTSDHSVVNELIQRGELTPEEAKTHPYAHVITRSVGPEENMKPEIHIFDRQAGDRYLLSSDGLDLHVDPEETANILASAADPVRAVNDLLRLVLQRGARDNVTILSVFA